MSTSIAVGRIDEGPDWEGTGREAARACRLCRARREASDALQDGLWELSRGIEELRLSLALHLSEMTELRAALAETGYRISKLRARGPFAG